MLQGGIGAVDLCDRISQLLSEICTGDWQYCAFHPAERRAFRCQFPEDHTRMVCKIAVDRDPVSCQFEMYPVRLNVDRMLPLLEEDDVRYDVGTCICPESVVGEADRAEEFRPLRQIFPDFRRLRIHRIAARDKCDHASRPYLVDRLGEEVVVDGKSELVIGLVIHAVLPERDIADSEVVEIAPVGRLESCDGDLRIRIELLCYSA